MAEIRMRPVTHDPLSGTVRFECRISGLPEQRGALLFSRLIPVPHLDNLQDVDAFREDMIDTLHALAERLAAGDFELSL